MRERERGRGRKGGDRVFNISVSLASQSHVADLCQWLVYNSYATCSYILSCIGIIDYIYKFIKL